MILGSAMMHCNCVEPFRHLVLLEDLVYLTSQRFGIARVGVDDKCLVFKVQLCWSLLPFVFLF